MTTTARTPYWFWSDDLVVIDIVEQSLLEDDEVQEETLKLKPVEK